MISEEPLDGEKEGWYWGEGSWNLWTGNTTDHDRNDGGAGDKSNNSNEVAFSSLPVVHENPKGGRLVHRIVPGEATTIERLRGLGIIEQVDSNDDDDDDDDNNNDKDNPKDEGWYWGEGSWNLWTGTDTGSNRDDLEA